MTSINAACGSEPLYSSTLAVQMIIGRVTLCSSASRRGGHEEEASEQEEIRDGGFFCEVQERTLLWRSRLIRIRDSVKMPMAQQVAKENNNLVHA
ncbi:hypothetical protein CEXT_42011 [Caerostris extrusa]|uniref:Uncharacterized protein n=1 Tax=Caerostris extrusa TaxID=172846 RepID=A0AAV4W346_CAEEX|nr:hypothetical protein CEXT_42011 [Caerostris extrusa]